MRDYLKSKSLTIEVTNACACNCCVCPRDKMTKKIERMDFDLFKSVIDQAIQGGADVVSVCGFGEALLDKGLKDKLCYIKEKYPFVKTYISTVGNLLDDYAFTNIIPLLDEIKVSHFSDEEAVFHRMHGEKVNFETTQQALDRLCMLPKGERPYLNFLFVQTEINEHETEAWIQRWEDKVDEIMVWKTHNWAGQWPDKAENHKEGEALNTCGRPFQGDLYVHVDGLVSPCCFDFDGQMIVGDLKSQTMEEIYFGREMEEMRRLHKEKKFTENNLLCGACDQVTNREGSLVYCSNKNRKVGVITSSRTERMNNVLEC